MTSHRKRARTMRRWAWTIGVSVALLAGCATTPEPPSTARASQAAPVAREADFLIDGRMSVVSHPHNAPIQAVNGRFSWLDQHGIATIGLFSPIGDTLAELTVSATQAQLRTAQQVDVAPAPEALVERHLGLALPVSGLRDWMRGFDHQGQWHPPAAFGDSGWWISYPELTDQGRPRIVRLERQYPQPIEVRLVIDQWSAP